MIALPFGRGLVVPLAALLLIAAEPVRAQGTDEQREACTPDALKLCADTIPDIPRTTACMKAHEAALSPRCRAAINGPAVPAASIAKREAYPPADDRRPHGSDEAAAEAVPPLGVNGGPEEAYGPDIRHFAPGDGPDEIGAEGPEVEERYWERGYRDDGPRRGHFADRDSEPYPDESREAPRGWRRGGGVSQQGERQRARAAIARLCDAGEMDPRDCALTERALGR